MIHTEAKTRYHAAVSMASNHVIGLLSMAVKMLEEAGIKSTAAYEMLTPLVKNNVEVAFEVRMPTGADRPDRTEQSWYGKTSFRSAVRRTKGGV